MSIISQLEKEGDSFTKLSPISESIQLRIEKAGLCPTESSDEELNQITTWEERLVFKLLSFYCCCSNNGCVYPHVNYGLSMTKELEAVGAFSTIKALQELAALQNEIGFKYDETVEKIEDQVPGDFEWADPILNFVRANLSKFS